MNKIKKEKNTRRKETLTTAEQILADLVRFKRIEIGLSQAELAKAVGQTATASWIGVVERGHKRISLAKYQLILKALGITLPQAMYEYIHIHPHLLNEDRRYYRLSKKRLKAWKMVNQLEEREIDILNAVLKIIITHSEKKEKNRRLKKLRVAGKVKSDSYKRWE